MGLLVLSVVALLSGPLAELAMRRAWWARAALDGFVLVAIAGLVLLHVVPHSAEVIGLPAVLAAGAGLAAPLLMERWVEIRGERAHTVLLPLGLIGLLVHSLFDGVALAVPSEEGELLGVAVLLHQLPVSIAAWWLLRPLLGEVKAFLVLVAIAAATVLGYALAAGLMEDLAARSMAVIQTAVAGSLLHVVWHRTPSIHDPGAPSAGVARASAIGGLVAIAVLVALASVHPLPHRAELTTGAALIALLVAAAPAFVAGHGAIVAAAFAGFAPPAALRGEGPFAGLEGAEAHDHHAHAFDVSACGCASIGARAKDLRALIGRVLSSPDHGLAAALIAVPLLGARAAAVRAAAGVAVLLATEGLVSRRIHGSDGAAASRFAALRASIHHASPWMALGFGVAALAEAVLAPDALSGLPFGAVALLALPVYASAAAATPVAAVLVHKGLSLGGAIALVVTLSSVSLGSTVAVARGLGARTAASLVAAIAAIGLGAGWLADRWLGGDAPALYTGDAPVGAMVCLAAVVGAAVASLLEQGVRGFAAHLGIGGHEHEGHGHEAHDHQDGHHGHDAHHGHEAHDHEIRSSADSSSP